MLIRLDSLSFSTIRGEFVVRESREMVFSKVDYLEKVISERKSYFEKLYSKTLIASPLYRETLREDQIIKVFEFTAEELGYTINDILEKTKKDEYVKARWYAMKICRDRGISNAVIGKEINYSRGTVKYGVETVESLIAIDRAVSRDYIRCLDSVLHNINGHYAEDGSGKKIEHEKK